MTEKENQAEESKKEPENKKLIHTEVGAPKKRNPEEKKEQQNRRGLLNKGNSIGESKPAMANPSSRESREHNPMWSKRGRGKGKHHERGTLLHHKKAKSKGIS